MDLISVRMQVSELFDNVVNSFSDEISDLIKNKTYIAGGCFKSLVLDEPVNDYDFWFRDKESSLKFIELLKKEKHTKSSALTNRDNLKLDKITLVSDNAVTFKFPKAVVQFIVFNVGSPDEVVGKFDFLHTQCYYDPIAIVMKCPTHYIIGKTLFYNKHTPTSLSTLKRAFKFVKQGWQIEDQELEAITKTLVGVDWKDPKEVKKQTKGMYKTPHAEEGSYAERMVARNSLGDDQNAPDILRGTPVTRDYIDEAPDDQPRTTRVPRHTGYVQMPETSGLGSPGGLYWGSDPTPAPTTMTVFDSGAPFGLNNDTF